MRISNEFTRKFSIIFSWFGCWCWCNICQFHNKYIYWADVQNTRTFQLKFHTFLTYMCFVLFFGFWILQSEISLRICDGVSFVRAVESSWILRNMSRLDVVCLLSNFKEITFLHISIIFIFLLLLFFLHSIPYTAMITVNWNVNTKIYTI